MISNHSYRNIREQQRFNEFSQLYIQHTTHNYIPYQKNIQTKRKRCDSCCQYWCDLYKESMALFTGKASKLFVRTTCVFTYVSHFHHIFLKQIVTASLPTWMSHLQQCEYWVSKYNDLCQILLLPWEMSVRIELLLVLLFIHILLTSAQSQDGKFFVLQ